MPEEVRAAAGERFGKYVRTGKLGAGGMGEVWKAWDGELNRWVALKFLKGGDDEEIARFKREAQTAGKLNHPNIAAIYETGEHGGRRFIAMQYVDGQTLTKFPRRDLRAVVKLVRDAAEAIQFAHEQGIVHRDVKPDNLMVTTRSEAGAKGKKATESHHVYVMDFGLARRAEGEGNVSMPGLVIGTPAYMSPEQARGEKVDARSDVFSLGATLYELLTNQRPFRGKNVYAILQGVQDGEVEPIRKVNPRVDGDLETIVLKCLEKSRVQRYRGAGELAGDLTRWLKGEPILARPASVVYRLRKFVGRRKGVVIPSLAALAVVVAFVAWGVAGGIEKSRRIDEKLAEAAEFEKAGKSGDARAAYEAVLALDGSNAEAEAGAERMKKLLERVDLEAEKAKKAAREEAKARIEAENARKTALDEAMGLLERARPALDRAVMLTYRSSADYSELGEKVEAARVLIEQAVEKAPQFAPARFLLGKAWKLNGWEDKAEESWRKAIECNTKYAPAHFELGRLLLERSYVAGLVRYGERRVTPEQVAESVRLSEAAAREIEAATAGSELDDQLQRDLAACMLDWSNGKHESARLKAEVSIEAYKGTDGCEDFYWVLGLVLADDEKRLKAYDKAIEIRPGHAWARFGRALTRQWRGDFDGAIADLDVALKINPRFLHARLGRGYWRWKKKDFEGTIADSSEALRIDPRCRKAYIMRGLARTEKGDAEGAIADYTEAGRLAPLLMLA